MKVLVVGASGATGRLLVEQLLMRGFSVRVIVRDLSALPESTINHEKLTAIQASVLDLDEDEMRKHVAGCDAVASCLGHNMSFKGFYGKPRRLVTDAARRLSHAIQENNPVTPVKYVLMNTTGNRNRDLNEPISFAQTGVIWLLRLLLPPHVDNEKAADFLRIEIGRNNPAVQWVVVRPDGLMDKREVTAYELHASPMRSAIFDAGTTSRINVAHFMAELISDSDLWNKWQSRMPVIYNREQG